MADVSSDAVAFGNDVLAQVGTSLPSAVVIDIGETANGWAVIEAIAAWASSRYHADPDRALDVVLRSAMPHGAVLDRDKPFLRNTVARP